MSTQSLVIQAATLAEYVKKVSLYARLQTYDVVPVGKQTWRYGDGHIELTEMGKKKAPLHVNLTIGLSIIRDMARPDKGGMKHAQAERLFAAIDKRGGVTITVWY